MEIRYGRKRRGIRKELREKLGQWLDSITDQNVRKSASKNVIVTGGSIASMLLGERVNDFDLYFRDLETTKMVADYYAGKFIELNRKAPLPVVAIDDIVNCRGIKETRVVISVNSAGVTQEDLDEEDTPVNKNTRYRPVFLSANAITLSDKVQLVTRFYGEPDQIHDNFDFQHAMCYYDYANDTLDLPSGALECLLSRTLVYKGSLYPIASVFRTKKFLERGWRISAGEQLKMMWQISELDLKDKKLLQEQLTGVDQLYLWQLYQALKDVDSEKLNSCYVTKVIDRIFLNELDPEVPSNE